MMPKLANAATLRPRLLLMAVPQPVTCCASAYLSETDNAEASLATLRPRLLWLKPDDAICPATLRGRN